MIDTLRVQLASSSWKPLNEIPDTWDIEDKQSVRLKFEKKLDQQERTVALSYFIQHRATGLRVWGSDAAPTAFEVSLPRVYHGRNGCVLRDDREINGAFLELEHLLYQVLIPSPTLEETNFALFDRNSRLDLCWQFSGDIKQWIKAFRNSKHPNVRKPIATHDGTGLVWPGRQLQIRIYDKRREVYNRPGDVVRVEFQMRGKFLKELGWRHFDEAWLGGFARLWSTFKDLVLPLNPEQLHEVNTLAEMFTLAEKENVKLNGQSFFEIWASGKSRSTVSRMQRCMKESLPRKVGIDLWDLTTMPIPVDLPLET